MAFQLYDAAAGGAAVGSPVNAGVPISDSLFTVGLDFGAAAFAGDARWLGIQVQCPGDAAFTDLGRQALTAAPYALYAQGAPWSGLTGVPAGFADGVDNDTTYTAGTGLALSGGAFSLLRSYQLPQGCPNGYIPEWNSTAWVCGVDDVGAGGGGWALTGNTGADPNSNFVGTTDAVTLTLRVSNTAALRLVPNATSPNLIGGYSDNWVTPGAYGAAIGGGGASGNLNRVTDNYGTVGGGHNNQAGDNAGATTDKIYATVGGGSGNTASGYVATVGGGNNNTAGGGYATVGGGSSNTADGTRATVGGGGQNIAGGDGATVGGGSYNGSASDGNEALAPASTIGGGYGNLITTTADYATIGGGQYITASGLYATVGGGYGNIAGEGATVGGGGYYTSFSSPYYDGNEALAIASTIGGGYGNFITPTAKAATISGGTNNIASGYYAAIGGGGYNAAFGESATVGGGYSNAARGNSATIGGGYGNFASGYYATIGGGDVNVASGYYAAIGGGIANIASGFYATIGGGDGNFASGYYATIGGGDGNVASGYRATVPGGSNAVADHFGQMAYANGSFSGTPGTAQASLYVMRRSQTMSAGAWYDLYLNGVDATSLMTITTGRTLTFDILVVGRTEAGESAGYQIRGVIENYGGTTAFIGAPVVTVLGEDDTAWNVRVVADNTTDALLVQVMGNGETIRWVATVQTAEVAW